MFHNAKLFDSCIIHILYTGCAKIKKKNSGAKGLIEGADIVRFIKAQRIKCQGHFQRIDQARPARKQLDWKLMGIRPVGRPRQRWQEDVMEDLKKLKDKNWKDRRTGRDLAEKAKTHKGL